MRIAACILTGSLALVAGCGTLENLGVSREDKVLMAGVREVFCDQAQSRLAAMDPPIFITKEALGKVFDAAVADVEEGSELEKELDGLVSGNDALAAALAKLTEEYLPKLKPSAE